ncbi:MAG: FliO/MopB family protein [Candidatus Acidulodesulfobacterium sp.]
MFNILNMNKIKSFFYIFCFISAVLVFFAAAFNKAYAENVLTLKGISVSESRKNNSYFIWFKFNGKPQKVLKNMVFKKYGFEAVFNNTDSYGTARQSKFVNFKGSRLFKAAEIIPAGNSELDAVVYFNKNLRIARKDVFASFYRNYLVIKIVHDFPADIFKNVGKKNAVLVNSAAAGKINKAKSKNPPKPEPSGKPNAGAFSNAKHLNLKNSSLKNPAGLNMGLEAVKTVVYLALIIGMIYGIYFFMNKFRNRVSAKEKINSLKIISSINLGNKKSILLIGVNKEFFLVGVSPSNIQMIGRLDGVPALQNSVISDYSDRQDKTPAKEIKESKEIKGKSAKQFSPEVYAEYDETPVYGNAGLDDAGNVLNTPFVSSSPAVKTYGRFADVMREKVGGRSDHPENAAADALDKSGKVKNINEAKFKNKADNIFFDIEERLKGLMESDVKSKKL